MWKYKRYPWINGESHMIINHVCCFLRMRTAATALFVGLSAAMQRQEGHGAPTSQVLLFNPGLPQL